MTAALVGVLVFAWLTQSRPLRLIGLNAADDSLATPLRPKSTAADLATDSGSAGKANRAGTKYESFVHTAHHLSSAATARFLSETRK